ncbi:MAG TPA: UvrD-helicase domain-containing protein [Pyrinomonadaceae bacterium]|jgi:DNA helicase-2/ATP-dependent DNA helicase PcrA|nr:UvrD-helicase domain-containing protein [Pyrinomonadaceae bacterium]
MHSPVDSDFLAQLNEQQREAVISTEGPLLILAGAGSGKTRVIAHRIAYLIAEQKVPFWNILAVTFTNKAADEMRQRIQRLLRTQERASLPLVSTFHSLCVRILRQDIEKLNDKYTRRFTIYDQDDSIRLIKQCIRDLGYDEKYLGPRATQSAISSAKNRAEDPTAFAARAEYIDERRAAMAKVYEMYETRLHGNNALDFDDLLIKAVRLLRDVPEVREKYNNKFRYILVDEYQDTNALQFELIRLITEKTKNIAVVGDEDQSIYKWRGADISNILNFEKHFPNTRTIRLEQNYRSTQTILDVAGAVVKNNLERKGKNLWTSNPRGGHVGYYQAFDAEAEARWVAQKILEHRRDEFDIRAAVLYRTNSQSRVFEEAMRRAGLQYNIIGGFSFYERMEVRDIIAYLKLALNPNDSIALGRVINSPPRGIGKNTIEEIERRARDYELSLWETIAIVIEQPGDLGTRAISALKNFRSIVNKLAELADAPDDSGKEPVSDVVRAAIIETGYEVALRSERTDEAEGRLENLQELVNAAVDYDEQGTEGLREFIDHSALVSDQDDYKRDAPVTLMTVHSAKGLEFPLVFIVGLEDGLFPHSRSATDRAELEEERRLAYVAMTRAERYLYVTHAMKRRVYGEELASEPSPFLNEMPTELLEDLSLGKSWLSFKSGSSTIDYEHGEYKKERKKYAGKTYDSVDSIAEFFKQRNRQMGQTSGSLPNISKAESTSSKSNEFTPGSYVKHSKYGRGLVLRREGAGESIKLTVSFPGYGQKKLVEKYAGLEKA